MSAPAFAAAQQTSRMINREDKLDLLKSAMYSPKEDRSARVVVIESWGGLGKTRLLYEALWRAGNPHVFPLRSAPSPSEAWGEGVIAADPLDFTEIRLHAFEDFMESVRDALSWHSEAIFSNYNAARNAYRRRRKDQVDFGAITAAAEAADKAFFEDYQALTQNNRLVLVLDTAEQLSYAGAPWLRKLLTPEDLDFSTRDQFLRLLQEKRLPNTTILLAGRPSAGDYFAEIAQAAPGNFEFQKIGLDAFSQKDTQTYLQQLAQDYQTYTEEPDYDRDLSEKLAAIAAGEDRIKILHLYTGGKPVLLALFTDVLAEGKEEPVALQDSPEEADVRLKAYSLEQIQFEIEEAFINLIFAKTGDIRSQILTALVRARRGLDTARLHFVLGSQPGQTFENWQSDSTLKTEIERELDKKNPNSLRHLSFVKSGFGGRLILQDELYRIYDRHMASDETARQDETQTRTELYRQLHEFTRANLERLKKERRRNRTEDEGSLYWESPARALSKTFRYLGREEEDRRIELEDKIFEAELERLHYKFRLDPDEGSNDAYLDLAEQWRHSDNLEYDVLSQVEVWRFIHYVPGEEYWRSFINFRVEAWPILEQTILANDVSGWIKRFFFRREYKRGIEFANLVEVGLATLPEPPSNILDHPFYRSERTCWKELCQIYLSQDIRDNITTLTRLATEMAQLLADGFTQASQFGLQPHTVENRLRRTTGYIYNVLGYSYNTIGYYREASQAYTDGLRYLRDTGFWTIQAVVQNNLSRALSELGIISRAIRICRDALDLREELGYENPIAVSHSTLALIYNNGLQPENAWIEAAMAAAYFRKLEDERGLGLALYHLGEALRRLATSTKEKPDSPEQLFETALEAISEAVRLFDKSPEIMRRIEVRIEQGCLFRDYMYYLKQHPDLEHNERLVKRMERYREQAIHNLKRALTLAQELDYPRHQLDALVDLAWAYYYAQEPELVEQTFQNSLDLACRLANNDQRCFLSEGIDPPTSDQAEPYIYMLLGKAWMVRGRLRMDLFIQRQEEIKKEISDRQARIAAVHQDQTAQQSLRQAAEAFVLALGYNELYSVRSPYIPVAFDALYDYLKKFNRIELRDFYQYQRTARDNYRIAKIEPVDLSDTNLFLEQSFGDYLTPLPGVKEVV